MPQAFFTLRGTGAAIDVSLGWIPDMVMINNMTDGDKLTIGYPSSSVIPFTSNSLLLKAGMRLKGATSGATFTLLDVLYDTGTVAGGDAAGWLFIDMETKLGTIATENFYVDSDSTSGVDDLTGVLQVNLQTSIDTEVASETGNAGVTAYVGSAGSAAKGFTIGSTVSEDAKLLYVWAFANERGESSAAKNSLAVS